MFTTAQEAIRLSFTFYFDNPYHRTRRINLHLLQFLGHTTPGVAAGSTECNCCRPRSVSSHRTSFSCSP